MTHTGLCCSANRVLGINGTENRVKAKSVMQICSPDYGILGF
jgi:hypothetical protein